jgi:hypothetical protein
MAHEPYKQIKKSGRAVREHRWGMEQLLGRELDHDEIVHHKDGNYRNNNPANLEVITRRAHGYIHYLKYPLIKRCQRAGCGKMFKPDRTKRKRAKTCSEECARLLAAETLRRRNEARKKGG